MIRLRVVDEEEATYPLDVFIFSAGPALLVGFWCSRVAVTLIGWLLVTSLRLSVAW